jgi:hypothetical protein
MELVLPSDMCSSLELLPLVKIQHKLLLEFFLYKGSSSTETEVFSFTVPIELAAQQAMLGADHAETALNKYQLINLCLEAKTCRRPISAHQLGMR